MGLQLCPGNRVGECSAEYDHDREHNEQQVDACTDRLGSGPGFTAAAFLAGFGWHITQGALGISLCLRACARRVWNFREHVSATATGAVKHVQRHRHCLRCIGAYPYANTCIDRYSLTVKYMRDQWGLRVCVSTRKKPQTLKPLRCALYRFVCDIRRKEPYLSG
jgi:hypothetical protein